MPKYRRKPVFRYLGMIKLWKSTHFVFTKNAKGVVKRIKRAKLKIKNSYRNKKTRWQKQPFGRRSWCGDGPCQMELGDTGWEKLFPGARFPSQKKKGTTTHKIPTQKGKFCSSWFFFSSCRAVDTRGTSPVCFVGRIDTHTDGGSGKTVWQLISRYGEHPAGRIP